MVSRSGILGWNHALHCEFEQGGLGARLKSALGWASITGGISGVGKNPRQLRRFGHGRTGALNAALSLGRLKGKSRLK
jgi:hypothetical protein